MSVYFASLALTVLVETSVALALVPERRRTLLVVVPLLNLLTHPLATWAHLHAGWPLLPLEALVTLVEALGLALVARLPAWQAVLVSLAANGLTTALALFVRMV